MNIRLDQNNVRLREISVSNTEVECKEESMQVYEIRNGMIVIEELCNSNLIKPWNEEPGYVETLGSYMLDDTPYAIKGSYDSNFQADEPTMFFRDKAVIQPAQDLSQSTTRMAADDSPLYPIFENKVQYYKEHVKQKTESFESYFNENEI